MSISNIADLELFLNNKHKLSTIKFYNVTPAYVIKLLKYCKVSLDESSIEINGWQCDYTIYGKYKKKKLIINGEAWNGDCEIQWEVD